MIVGEKVITIAAGTEAPVIKVNGVEYPMIGQDEIQIPMDAATEP